MAPAETVLLISSASRTPYVRDILDALCYPNSCTMSFRYLPLWLSTSLKDPKTINQELNGRTGLIVFADIVETETGQEYRFYPVRLVTIIEPSFVGPVLYVPMILGDFVDYGSKSDGREHHWHSEIAALPGVPAILRQPGAEASFVLKTSINSTHYTHPGPPKFVGWGRAETGWESVIEVLASTRLFRESSFYRIESILNEKGKRVEPVRVGMSARYRFKFDTTIRLQLSFYHRRAEYIEGRTLKVLANQELFSGDVGRSILADYQYNRTDIRLLIRRRFERDLTTIRIVPDEWKPSPSDILEMAARRAKDVDIELGSPAGEFPKILKESEAYVRERVAARNFFAAAPEIIVELSPPWRAILIAALLLVIGTVLVSLPPDSIKSLLESFGVAKNAVGNWAIFARSVGGLFAFLGLVYVFRRWPLK